MALFLLAACGGTENIGDKLSAEEIKYLQSKSVAQCKTDTEDDYSRFLSDSNAMFGSGNFVRNKSWKYELKSDTTVLEEHKITVWKQDLNNIYFIVTITPLAGLSTYKFIKIEKAKNKAMVEEFRNLYCATKANPSTMANTTLSDTRGWFKSTLRSTYSPTQDQQVTTTNTYYSTLPAYFSFYASTQTTETITKETGVISATKKSTGTLVAIADEAPINGVYSGYATNITTFCEMIPAASPAVIKYPLPYVLDCQPNATATFKAEL